MAFADDIHEQAKAYLSGERVPPNVNQRPRLVCRVFGHAWTKAPFAAGRPMEGARTTAMEAWWPYCRWCYTPKRPGARGHVTDRHGWTGTGPHMNFNGEYAPSPELTEQERSPE